MRSPYKRVVVKVSGNILFSFDGTAKEIDPNDSLSNILEQVKKCSQQGIQITLVFGGGNICRGGQMVACGVKRSTADNIGMLATVINSLIIREKLIKMGVKCVLLNAFSLSPMAKEFEPYSAVNHLEQGCVVICSGGTGNPFVTTDTAASMRSIQTESDALIKLTKVDGVYDKDPKKHEDAKLFSSLTYDYVLEKQLRVMDLAAFDHCKRHAVPLHVANFSEPDVICRIVNGGKVGTIISSEGNENA